MKVEYNEFSGGIFVRITDPRLWKDLNKICQCIREHGYDYGSNIILNEFATFDHDAGDTSYYSCTEYYENDNVLLNIEGQATLERNGGYRSYLNRCEVHICPSIFFDPRYLFSLNDRCLFVGSWMVLTFDSSSGTTTPLDP